MDLGFHNGSKFNETLELTGLYASQTEFMSPMRNVTQPVVNNLSDGFIKMMRINCVRFYSIY